MPCGTPRHVTDGNPRPTGPRLPQFWALKFWLMHGFTVLALAIWFAASAVSPPYLVPEPLQVAREAARYFTESHYFLQMGASVLHVVFSMVFGFAAAGAL